jgi:RNA 3'-terminal phosphate cyclase (ATP)
MESLTQDIITIDGSQGEGGGQIIRTSLSLAAVTGKAVTVRNVRARRSKPGLQPQHLMAVQAAAALCDAATDGAAVGSQQFTFAPTVPVKPGDYRFDIGTAGAAPLVIQTVLIPLALAGGESRVTVKGGTHVPHAPAAQYLQHVYAALLAEHGLSADIDSPAAGFFPRGGGEITAKILPSWFTPVDLTERGRLRGIDVYVVTSQLPEHVAERGASAAAKELRGFRKPAVHTLDLPSRGQGAAVVIVAECDTARVGFSAIGERGKPMERVAEEACRDFAAWYRTEAACDEHLADQLVLPMALTPGESRWTTSQVTEHLRTVLWLTAQFLPIEFDLEEHSDGSGVVTITGHKR